MDMIVDASQDAVLQSALDLTADAIAAYTKPTRRNNRETEAAWNVWRLPSINMRSVDRAYKYQAARFKHPGRVVVFSFGWYSQKSPPGRHRQFSSAPFVRATCRGATESGCTTKALLAYEFDNSRSTGDPMATRPSRSFRP